jgi:hypothetical protein
VTVSAVRQRLQQQEAAAAAVHQGLGERPGLGQPLRGGRQAGQVLRKRQLLPGAALPDARPLARLQPRKLMQGLE